MTMPAIVLDAPPVVPESPYGGLLGAATVLPMPPRGELGIEFTPDACTAAMIEQAPCIDGQPAVGPIFAGDFDVPDDVTALPFYVYHGAACAPFGDGGFTNLADRARRNLRQGEGRAVEAALWATPPSITLLDAADDIISALAQLESHLAANVGGPGMIHAPVITAAYAASNNLVIPDRARVLRTAVGNAWVFGAGYDAQDGPAGGPAEVAAWLYATGHVTAYRSEPFTFPEQEAHAFDRLTNQTQVIAARAYVLTWACDAIAIPVVNL